MPVTSDGMRLEGLAEDSVVVIKNILLRGVFLIVRNAQKQHDVFNPPALVLATEGEEIPETLRLLDALIIRGWVKDIVKPALRLGEPLVLAKMHSDCERDVEKQLPIVVSIRPVLGDIDRLRRIFNLDEVVFGRVVKVSEVIAILWSYVLVLPDAVFPSLAKVLRGR